MTDEEPRDSFVMLPVELLDLVAAEKLTINAAWLYALLLSHINHKRGNRKVWPSRADLARRMRMKNPRAVDRYITELIEAKLIERERRCDETKVNDTNLYTLRLVCEPKKPEGVVRASTPPSASQHTRGSASEDTRVVGHSAHELDEPQLHKEQLDQPSLSSGHEATAAVASVAVPQPREREGGFKNLDSRSLPERLVSKRGWNERDAKILVAEIEDLNYIEGIGWWVTADKNGTLDDLINDAREHNRWRKQQDLAERERDKAALMDDPWASAKT